MDLVQGVKEMEMGSWLSLAIVKNQYLYPQDTNETEEIKTHALRKQYVPVSNVYKLNLIYLLNINSIL